MRFGSSLEDRQKLIRRTERQNGQGCGVRVAERPVTLQALGIPRSVWVLMSKHCRHHARKKLFPIGAAQLVHSLTRIEQAVMIPVDRRGVVAVVFIKAMREHPSPVAPRSN